MSATILHFPTRPSIPPSLRIIVVDSGEHGCPTCPICGQVFKSDLGYWPHVETQHDLIPDYLEPVCLDCAGIHDLGNLGRKLGELQDDVWRLQGEDGIAITRMEISWPGGTICLHGSEVVLVKDAPAPQRAAR